MKNPLNLIKHLPFFLRRKFDEKYIIIESDDWGLERTVSEDSINWTKKKFGCENLTRWSYDSLETPEDLDGLYGVISKYKSKFEYPPVITANFITHNIDYKSRDKLNLRPLSSGFFNGADKIRQIYDSGLQKEYIFPQLHGYSHYNFAELNKYFESDEGKEAFKENSLTARSTVRKNLKFLQGELSKLNSDNVKITEAAEEFKNYFGFYSGTIIPPTFIFDIELRDLLKSNNITLVQSSNRLVSSDNRRYMFPYFQKRKGLIWSVRNARLDPHKEYNFNHGQCIESIRTAFKYGSPAVIDFHRVNFSGTYAPEYRDRTLKELDLLFEKIYLNWPDAKFINSQKLNDMLWQL